MGTNTAAKNVLVAISWVDFQTKDQQLFSFLGGIRRFYKFFHLLSFFCCQPAIKKINVASPAFLIMCERAVSHMYIDGLCESFPRPQGRLHL